MEHPGLREVRKLSGSFDRPLEDHVKSYMGKSFVLKLIRRSFAAFEVFISVQKSS